MIFDGNLLKLGLKFKPPDSYRRRIKGGMNMYKQLKELVTQYVDVSPESITRDSRFVEDLGFDSLDFIAMIGDIEEHFQIETDISDLLEIKTVDDMFRYIERVAVS
ncbi:acyl carrier protein [Hungatella hathewayi]|uniref:Acyl carrier protein n=1 Tax=Hungatella hathewayi TaxID=154046 RepID=A0AAW9WHU4_9FIRM|nr:acyl carrier protein [Hungatella hathewayi]MUB64143.1 acyl carrier protein [Hungatella hathewayi]RGZ07858.1 acyl carrier protein [Hungatella hathewayi]